MKPNKDKQPNTISTIVYWAIIMTLAVAAAAGQVFFKKDM